MGQLADTPNVSLEASLLAHVMGNDVEGALSVAEKMTRYGRERFSAQLTSAKEILYAASAAANARAKFVEGMAELLTAALERASESDTDTAKGD